jgi:CheY-like chemotaxis protein
MPQAAAMLSTRKPLVLIVEDFIDAREMYEEYLAFHGFRVIGVCDGKAAIERALALSPDVILMDLSLPVLDGWEATRRLKRDRRTRHIPVVAITANALRGASNTAREAGCDAFLAKPCLLDELLAEIRRVLFSHERGSRGGRKRGRALR